MNLGASGILSTIAEDDIVETPDAAACTALTPPPAKRRRMASERQSQTATATPDWHFVRGRKMNGKHKIHLEDPLGARYTRNGKKEKSWRCSSKTNNCPAVVRKRDKTVEHSWSLEGTHCCTTKKHGPENVTQIQVDIQARLSATQEALTVHFNLLNANS